MIHPSTKTAGALFFIASTQFVLGLIAAEALYPGYSIADNYISDLGIGPSSMIFNSSVFLLGLLSIIGTYFLPRTINFRTLTILLVLMAIGTMGAGIITKTFTITHSAVSSIAFLFSGLSAIASFKVLKMPLSAISVILGLITLGALALFAGGLLTSGAYTSNETPVSDLFLGIGPGGMERMIVYPTLTWLAGFSGHLIALSEKKEILK
ncbi:DUF998 domain-containing protein [Candidatus Bathyarchaeota archaeon]|nr:DUF998 domain-containing protein [Candidatus Bathyarchaeota archaeon]